MKHNTSPFTVGLGSNRSVHRTSHAAQMGAWLLKAMISSEASNEWSAEWSAVWSSVFVLINAQSPLLCLRLIEMPQFLFFITFCTLF